MTASAWAFDATVASTSVTLDDTNRLLELGDPLDILATRRPADRRPVGEARRTRAGIPVLRRRAHAEYWLPPRGRTAQICRWHRCGYQPKVARLPSRRRPVPRHRHWVTVLPGIPRRSTLTVDRHSWNNPRGRAYGRTSASDGASNEKRPVESLVTDPAACVKRGCSSQIPTLTPASGSGTVGDESHIVPVTVCVGTSGTEGMLNAFRFRGVSELLTLLSLNEFVSAPILLVIFASCVRVYGQSRPTRAISWSGRIWDRRLVQLLLIGRLSTGAATPSH
jgi:hypothetical protein